LTGTGKGEKGSTISAVIFFINFILFSLLIAITAYLFIFAFREFIYAFTSEYKSLTVDSGIREAPLIVIDPGHGGEDTGATGIHGEDEKDINLKVSQMLYDMLKLAGYNPVMTRTDDRLLYDMYSDLKDYKGLKKAYDLRNRVKFANENKATVFVSIHMNKFPKAQAKGVEIYYSPNNEESQKLAEIIHGYTKQYFQRDNERAIKKAGTNIFVLKRLTIPSVLVECGFLSNEEECLLLGDDAYLKKLSVTLFCSISEFMGYYTAKG
jgi:N-acetylmuramoyl-L-alanine amidase